MIESANLRNRPQAELTQGEQPGKIGIKCVESQRLWDIKNKKKKVTIISL